MKRYLSWVLTMMLLFASVGPSLSVVMAESIEGSSIESLELIQPDESLESLEAKESVEVDGSVISADPVISDETDAQAHEAEKTLSPDFLILELVGAVDDNTLVIKGLAGPGVVVELKNQSDQVLQSVVADSKGNFEFKLNAPFAAETVLKIQSYKDALLLNELNLKVEGRGLHYEPVTDQSTEIIGSTSPNKMVALLNAEGTVLEELQSDSNGNFQFNLLEPLVADTLLLLQVKDDGRVAREESLKVVASESEVKEKVSLQSLAITPKLISLVTGTVRDGIKVDNLTITDTTETITGYVTAEASLIDVKLIGLDIGRLVTALLLALSGKSITLEIANTDGQIIFTESKLLSSLNDLAFSFDIPKNTLIPGTSQITLSVESVTVLGLVTINFKELPLSVTGSRLEFSSVPKDIIFDSVGLDYKPHDKIDHNQMELLTLEVLDTISLSYPDQQQWKVMVYAKDPLTLTGNDGVNHLLSNALFFNKELIEGSTNAQLVATNLDFTDKNNGLYSYTIPAKDDFYLQLKSVLEVITGTYTTTIQWDLVIGP